MITIRRMLLGLLLVGSVACFQWLSQPAKIVDLDVRPVKASLLATEDVNEQSASQLSDGSWTEFTINPFSRRIRVLANATIEPHQIAETQTGEKAATQWRFCLEYQLLDSSGRVLKAGDYSFRSTIPGQFNEETGAFEPRVFADAGRLIATGSESMELASTLPLATGVHRAAVLRLREKSKLQSMAQIFVRVFDQMTAEHLEKVETWQQLSIDERNRICAESVYTSDLLSDGERQSMLKLRWVPAIKRNQFDTQSLYFRKSPRRTEHREATPETLGTLISPGRYLVFRVPDGPGHVRVHASTEKGGDDVSLEIRYQCADSNDLLSFQGTISAARRDAFPVNGGLLLLRAKTPIRVRAIWCESLQTDDSIPLPPDETTIASVMVDSRPAQFNIHPTKYNDTLVRFVLRVPDVGSSGNVTATTLDGPTGTLHAPPSQAPQVRFQFLDQDGEVVGESFWECDAAISAFDHCVVKEKVAQVSEPAECYFSLSPNVFAVRVGCDDFRVLVSSYVRPNGLPWKIDLRNETRATERAERVVSKSWFSIDPRDEAALKAEQRICSVKLQSRPVERNVAILSGRYQWHQFQPNGMWIGNEAMVAAEQQIGDPARSAMSLYYAIEPLGEYVFESFVSDHVATSTSGRLICIADGAIGKLTVFVDGQAWFTRAIASRCATIDLPNPLPDSGTIQISSEGDARVFLRGRVVHKAQRFYRRTLHALADLDHAAQSAETRSEKGMRSGRLTFPYEKLSDADEMVSVKFFASDSNQVPVARDRSLRLRIDGVPDKGANKLLPSWTIRNRVYRFTDRFSDQSIVFDTGKSLSSPVQCIIKLGSDLPQGDYRLVVESPGACADCYVLVTQSVAGESPQRFLHRDK